jgi:hypothetical protein
LMYRLLPFALGEGATRLRGIAGPWVPCRVILDALEKKEMLGNFRSRD